MRGLDGSYMFGASVSWPKDYWAFSCWVDFVLNGP